MTKDIKKILKAYEPAKYSSGITVAKLIAVALHRMNEEKIKTTFENVVVSVHRLFPEKFSLLNFPDIPDTMRIDNTLRLDAKKHGQFLKGNRVKGYLLTGLGKQAAEATIEQLESGRQTPGKKIIGKIRKQETRLMMAILESSAFEKFSTKQYSEINKFDVCDVLHGTLESNLDELRTRNLSTLKGSAELLNKITEYQKPSALALEFLKYLENNWERLMK